MGKYTKSWWDLAKQFKVSLFDEETLKKLLEKCRDREERVCLILLYYTGARPSEILQLRKPNIWLEESQGDSFVRVSIPTLKGGIGRTLPLPLNQYLLEVLEHVKALEGDERVIRKWDHYWNIRDFIYRITENTLTAYFFRHNRISQLANAGADSYSLKRWKGAKNISSVETYLQLAGSGLEEIGKKLK